MHRDANRRLSSAGIPVRRVWRKDRQSWWACWSEYRVVRGRRVRKYHWRKLGENAALADRALRRLQEELLAPASQAKQRPRIKLREWVAEYVRDRIHADTAAWGHKQAVHLERYVLPFMGGEYLDEITPADVEALQGKLLGERSRKYVRHIIASLKTCLRRAEGTYVDVSPIHAVRLPRAEKRIPQTMTRDQVNAMRKALEGLDRALFTLWVSTGLRKDEMRFLQWGDVDLRHRRLYVRAKPDLGHSIKDHEDRVLPLTDAVVRELQPFAVDRDAAAFFYPSAGGAHKTAGKAWSNFTRRVIRMFADAGVCKGNPLLLRHTFASLVLSSGCSLAELQRYMGHSSITVTERHYAAFLPSDRAGIHQVDFGL